MAGGGVKKGFVYGKSDALGGEPDENPVGPEDLARTMYRLLGINASKRIVGEHVRPIDIVNGGQLLTDLIA
jgi:arylsulfatase A-like enzyme